MVSPLESITYVVEKTFVNVDGFKQFELWGQQYFFFEQRIIWVWTFWALG